MSYDHECRKCYEKTLGIIKEYLKTQCKEGESLEAEVYGSYGNDCYVSIDYATIVNKKHIVASEHMPINFLSRKYMHSIIPHIVDSLLMEWRAKS